MVGAKLYERGASIGQVMAFLIASPWNSFSLTLTLVTNAEVKSKLKVINHTFIYTDAFKKTLYNASMISIERKNGT